MPPDGPTTRRPPKTVVDQHRFFLPRICRAVATAATFLFALWYEVAKNRCFYDVNHELRVNLHENAGAWLGGNKKPG